MRSVAARHLLVSRHAFRNVLTLGLQNTRDFWKDMLLGYAHAVLVVGSEPVWELLPEYWRYKAIFLNVGQDVWGNFRHPGLLAKLEPMIERLVKG